MKRKVLILTTLMLGMCQGIPVYAAEPIAVAKAEEGVMPLYEHIRSTSTVIVLQLLCRNQEKLKSQ